MGQVKEVWALEDCIAQFLRFLTVEKNASQNTISAYRNDLAQFARFAADKGLPTGQKGCEQASAGLIVDYVADLRARSYKDATVARKVAAVKSFFSFLAAEGLVSQDPTENLKSPQVGKSLPRALSSEEVDQLLEQPLKDRQTPEKERDHAMIELLYATGLRVSELVSLDVDDLNLNGDPPTVRCSGKGDRERVLPLPAWSAQGLRRYLVNVRPRLARKPARGREEASARRSPLFVNRRGERLTRQGFWLILKQYARLANLDRAITPHTLRHTFATHMLSGGMPLRNVQDALGHASISTTQVYTHLSNSEKRREYDKAHPRA